MRDLVALFYFAIVVSGLPSYPIHPGVGAIYKGADSQIVIQGPDGSILNAQAGGGSVASGLNAAIAAPAVYVTEPAPVFEINKELIANGLYEDSTNIEGPSGTISTSGSRSIIAGPASTTITGPEVVGGTQTIAAAPITQVRKSAVSISRTETVVATSVAPPIVVEDAGAAVAVQTNAHLRGRVGLGVGQRRVPANLETQQAAAEIQAQQQAAAQIEAQQQVAAQIEARQRAATQIEAQQRAAAQIEAQQRAAAQSEAQQRAAAQNEAQQRAAAQIEAQQRAAAQIEAQQRAAAQAQQRAAAEAAQIEAQQRTAAQEQAAAKIREEEQAAAQVRIQQRVAATIQAREQAAAEIRAQEEGAAEIRAHEQAEAEAQAQQQVAVQIQAEEQQVAEIRTRQRVEAEVRAQEQVAASIRAQQEASEIRAQQQAAARYSGATGLGDPRLNGAGISRGAANRPSGRLFAPAAPPTSVAASGLSSARLSAGPGLAGSPEFLVGGALGAAPQLVTAEIATPQLITAEIPTANLITIGGVPSGQLLATPGLTAATAEVTNGLIGAKFIATGFRGRRLTKANA